MQCATQACSFIIIWFAIIEIEGIRLGKDIDSTTGSIEYHRPITYGEPFVSKLWSQEAYTSGPRIESILITNRIDSGYKSSRLDPDQIDARWASRFWLPWTMNRIDSDYKSSRLDRGLDQCSVSLGSSRFWLLWTTDRIDFSYKSSWFCCAYKSSK